MGLSTYDHQLDRSRRAARQATEIPRVDGSGVIRVTASLGVASMPEAARDITSLIAAADSALYRTKSSGKNRSEQATADEAAVVVGRGAGTGDGAANIGAYAGTNAHSAGTIALAWVVFPSETLQR